MDKETLVMHVNRLVAEFGKTGRSITNAAIAKAFPEYESSPFILAFACPWMVGYDSCYGKTDEIVEMMYKHLPPDAIRKIHAVNVFDTYAEVDHYIKNECRMQDASCFQILPIVHEEHNELTHA